MRWVQGSYKGCKTGIGQGQGIQGRYKTATKGARWVAGSYMGYKTAIRQLQGCKADTRQLQGYNVATRGVMQVQGSYMGCKAVTKVVRQV